MGEAQSFATTLPQGLLMLLQRCSSVGIEYVGCNKNKLNSKTSDTSDKGCSSK